MKWKGTKEGPMIGFLFGQEKAAFFLSYKAVEKAQPVWATGDIRAKLCLETPRTGQGVF